MDFRKVEDMPKDCCIAERGYVPYFAGWTDYTATVPKLYWDVYSQEERIHRICELVHKIACYCDMLGDKITIDRTDIDYLLDQFEKFKESGFDDYYAQQVIAWIDSHMQFIFEHVIKGVYFGLTMDGYFCAFIPDSWNDIEFDTGAVYGEPEYGRLMLIY